MRKISFNILVVVIAFALASCNTDAEKAYYESTGGVDAGFSSTVLTRNLASAENGEFSIKVYRGNATGAATIPVEITSVKSVLGTTETDAPGMFSLQSPDVVFADGETEAFIKILYEFSSLDPVPTYQIDLSLNEEDVSPAAQKSIRVRAKMLLEYESIGTGSITSSLFGDTWDVDVHKAQGVDAYKFKDAYVDGYDIGFIISGDNVIAENQNTGYFYSDDHGFVWFNPEADEIIDGGVKFTVKFALPLSGASFTGTFAETFMLP